MSVLSNTFSLEVSYLFVFETSVFPARHRELRPALLPSRERRTGKAGGSESSVRDKGIEKCPPN